MRGTRFQSKVKLIFALALRQSISIASGYNYHIFIINKKKTVVDQDQTRRIRFTMLK